MKAVFILLWSRIQRSIWNHLNNNKGLQYEYNWTCWNTCSHTKHEPSQSINKTSNFLLLNVNNHPIKLLLLTYSHPLLFCYQIETVLLNTILDANKCSRLYMTQSHSKIPPEIILTKQTKIITNNSGYYHPDTIQLLHPVNWKAGRKILFPNKQRQTLLHKSHFGCSLVFPTHLFCSKHLSLEMKENTTQTLK